MIADQIKGVQFLHVEPSRIPDVELIISSHARRYLLPVVSRGGIRGGIYDVLVRAL